MWELSKSSRVFRPMWPGVPTSCPSSLRGCHPHVFSLTSGSINCARCSCAKPSARRSRGRYTLRGWPRPWFIAVVSQTDVRLPAAGNVYVQNERIQKALAYIEAHFRSKLARPKMAAAAHLSEFHFSRLFSRLAAILICRLLDTAGWVRVFVQQVRWLPVLILVVSGHLLRRSSPARNLSRRRRTSEAFRPARSPDAPFTPQHLISKPGCAPGNASGGLLFCAVRHGVVLVPYEPHFALLDSRA